jgi:hypothetical protein
MEQAKLYEDFINDKSVNENIRKQMPAFIEKIRKAEEEFPEKNKRSALLKLADKANGSETIDQDTKFTYTPDGQVFVVYKYEDQEDVDAWLYNGKGSEKSKENLVRSMVYAETGRPGWRILSDESKMKIGKYGETKY